ncbi:MAG: hypothetical protein HYV65_03410 [Candidatus Spechtbacteria bacterium]|nr:hypothetical protein [Candidatus Spechtbacteria bacterium]
MKIPTYADSVKRQTKIITLIQAGVIIIDPDHIYIEDKVSVGSGTIIYPGVVIEGGTTIGRECVIGPNNYIADSRIADNCVIGTFCRIESSVINPQCKIEDNAQIKRSFLGMRVKAKHFCYIGDARIGAECNIGAGAVFCNYDGVHKNKTVLDKSVFVGSGSMLVAPLHVGKYAYIAAGSIVTKDVPEATPQTKNRGTLVIARGQRDRTILEALGVIGDILQERSGIMTVSNLVEQFDTQIHKVGYVRVDKDGWHIEKPGT